MEEWGVLFNNKGPSSFVTYYLPVLATVVCDSFFLYVCLYLHMSRMAYV